jgi:hypothetical protein
MLTEILHIATDIRTGALPVREIPAFLLCTLPRPLTVFCAAVAVIGTVVALWWRK